MDKRIYRLQPICVGYKESMGITIALDVEETKLSLYKSLLPEQLELPPKPQVMFYIYHFTKIFPWPLKGYLEAAVCLRAQHPKTLEGWYVLYMPVSSRMAYRSGKWVGYPKYIPDSLTLEASDADWVGKIIHNEKSPFILKFAPAMIDVWWKDVYRRDSAFFLVNKDKQINQMQPVIQRLKSYEIKTGNITLTIDTDEKWANLVQGSNQTRPGIFHKFVGKVFLTRTGKKPL
jgi:hypothetical protein